LTPRLLNTRVTGKCRIPREWGAADYPYTCGAVLGESPAGRNCADQGTEGHGRTEPDEEQSSSDGVVGARGEHDATQDQRHEREV
jgi:hypothetical protein